MRRRAPLAAGLVVGAALAAAGCGSSNAASERTATPAPAKPAATATATATATKPKVPKGTGKPPRHLVVKDLISGTGPAARPGDAVSVQYVGVNFKTGKQFDASWDRGQAFRFELGGGQVIPGWDRGIVGMRVGGRRELIIPPALGYGSQGQPPVIKPNETLIFVVDLQQIG